MANIKNVIGRPVVTVDGQRVIAGTLVDGANDWTAANKPPHMHLYANDPPIIPAMVLADLEEVAGSGYAEVSLDSLSGAVDEDGVPVLQNDFSADFELTALDTLFGATGYYITDEAGDSLIGVERFDDPFPFDEVGDKIVITPRILLPGFVPPEDVP